MQAIRMERGITMARVTIEQIETKEFAVINKGGYDPQEVDEFLDAIMDEMALQLDEIARLNQEVAALRARPVQPVQPVQPVKPVQQPAASENNAARALEILEMAQKVREETIAKAQAEANEMLAEAKSRMTEQFGDLSEMREKLTSEIANLKLSAADYRARLTALMKEQQELLDKSADLF